MGWYHVGQTGKGMVLGDEKAIKYRREPFERRYGSELEPDHSFADVLRLINNESEDGAWISHEENDDEYLMSEQAILPLALAGMFEEKYGYPAGSFRSVSDYDGNVMLFCNSQWPPEEYNQALAELTEEKLEKQMREFLVEVTGDKEFAACELEICEEYVKE